MDSSRVLSLPRELRNMIYYELIPKRIPLATHRNRLWLRAEAAKIYDGYFTLRLACKLLSGEIQEIFDQIDTIACVETESLECVKGELVADIRMARSTPAISHLLQPAIFWKIKALEISLPCMATVKHREHDWQRNRPAHLLPGHLPRRRPFLFRRLVITYPIEGRRDPSALSSLFWRVPATDPEIPTDDGRCEFMFDCELVHIFDDMSRFLRQAPPPQHPAFLTLTTPVVIAERLAMERHLVRTLEMAMDNLDWATATLFPMGLTSDWQEWVAADPDTLFMEVNESMEEIEGGWEFEDGVEEWYRVEGEMERPR